MRIVFMGTPDFSVTALDALIAAGHDIVCVYTQPPRPAGRGKKDRPSPVQSRAEALGLKVRHPVSLKGAEAQQDFADLNPDVAVVVAYGLLLPRPILDAPVRGCINIHASLLPRWRGAAPIQRAIMAGDHETGVCIMQMELGLDTGPVAHEARTPIHAHDTAATLHDRLAGIGAASMVQVLDDLAKGPLTLTPQPADGIYAAKIDKAEARIDWSRPAAEVDRHIRGLSPFPGAWFELGGDRVKALLSEMADGQNANAQAAPGEVLDGSLTVACGDGAIRLTRLQRAGKGAVGAEDFLRGKPLSAGAILR